MAPRAPTPTAHRLKAFARLADPTIPRKTHRPEAQVADGFNASKRDRQQIRRSVFLDRVAESSRSIVRKPKKPRRPQNKLVASLASLADALPEVDTAAVESGTNAGKVKHKSLRSRPGALKRKEKLLRIEVERFGKSLGQLMVAKGGEVEIPPSEKNQVEVDGEREASAESRKAGEQGSKVPEVSTANRWAMLRGFISATMQQNPAFASKG